MVLDFGRLLGRAFVLAVAVGLLLTLAAAALPAPAQEKDAATAPGEATCGRLLVRRADGEPWAAAPNLATEVRFRVAGVVARASVKQRFQNGTDGWVEGVYVFPLPENAAVDHLLMRVGERTIEGQIREREQAKAEYQQAKGDGRKASLVEQERPNLFTTSVANVGPGEEVTVEIEFQQTLRFDEGEVRLRFPLVVGPRYIPGQPTDSLPEGLGWAFDTDAVPDASRITPPLVGPGLPPRNPVSIEIELDPGFPLVSLVSRYHAIVSQPMVDGRYHVALRDAAVPADRDFELAWRPRPGAMPRGAAFLEEKGGATYALVTLFPPAGDAVDQARLPREVVYVIDTSGSMEGLSIQQARQALALAIDRLKPKDRFNVIEFNSVTRALWQRPRPASDDNRSLARGFVERLRAQGGTEMAPALEAALVGSDEPSLVRQVVFLTDGSVGNEAQLFSLIKERLGDTRLFTVGIGSAPNSHFMTKAAEFGYGTFTYIGDVREVEEKMARLFKVLESPVLTGVELSWPAGAAVEAWPARIPDLYLGEPVVVSARLTRVAAGDISVAGRRGSESWTTAMSFAGGRRADGAAVLWARRKIEALVDSQHEGADAEEVRKQVVALGLEHHLVTKHTSLVAVDVTPSRPADASLATSTVLTNLPYGWTYAGVGALPQTATAAPLHALASLLGLLAAFALWWADRAWRSGERS
jgi:Ca-activated chloride channel family protein